MMKKYTKYIAIITIIFSISYLLINFTHHHTSTQEHHNCQICHFNSNVLSIIPINANLEIPINSLPERNIHSIDSFWKNLIHLSPTARYPPIF